MPNDPRKTWEHFARAAIQEQDPEKLSRLIQQLYRALDEDENKPKRKPLKVGEAV